MRVRTMPYVAVVAVFISVACAPAHGESADAPESVEHAEAELRSTPPATELLYFDSPALVGFTSDHTSRLLVVRARGGHAIDLAAEVRGSKAPISVTLWQATRGARGWTGYRRLLRAQGWGGATLAYAPAFDTELVVELRGVPGTSSEVFLGCTGAQEHFACALARQPNDGCSDATFGALACEEGLFCKHGGRSCGAWEQQGACRRVPRVCTMILRPVCGCDGRTYANECVAEAERVSTASDGVCVDPT